MKKLYVFLSLLFCVGVTQASSLPDNIYMKAMRDEMKRSMAKLRRTGVEKPYFIAYKLEQVHAAPAAQASLGALYPVYTRDSELVAYTWVSIGNAQHDSLGYMHDSYYAKDAYRPVVTTDVAKSYKGIRQGLWRLTDIAYRFASETYQQKQAYERSKQTDTQNKLPDVIPVKQSTYEEEILPPQEYDMAELQAWVKEQSSLGKELPFVEQFEVSVQPVQRDTYYLNSWGGFYQKSFSAVNVTLSARMRDNVGFKRVYNQDLWLQDFSPEIQAEAAQEVQTFLHNLTINYQVVEGESYVGPVLLLGHAAGHFIYEQLGKKFQNLKPLAAANAQDATVGKFTEEGQRVMSPGITVWDDPEQRSVWGYPLPGFMPVDDEGVKAQPITLVNQGRVVEIPRTTRPLEDKKISNGHARLTKTSMPREQLTNVFVTAENTFTEEQLKEKLLARCKELGLEYGYVMYEWPNADNENHPVLERTYLNGDAEAVYGMQIDGITTRSLRDINAVGENYKIVYVEESKDRNLIPTQAVVAPSLLLEELEFVFTRDKPDQKPFVPKP